MCPSQGVSQRFSTVSGRVFRRPRFYMHIENIKQIL
jgi:hypothetical protein